MKISIDSSSLVRFVSSSFFRLPLFIVFEGNERKRKEGEKRGKRKSRRGTLILWNVTKQRLSRRALRSSFSDRLAIDPRQKGIGPTDGWRSLAPPRSSFECNYSCIDIPSVLVFPSLLFFPLPIILLPTVNQISEFTIQNHIEIILLSLFLSPIIHPFQFHPFSWTPCNPHYQPSDYYKFIIRGIKHGAY